MTTPPLDSSAVLPVFDLDAFFPDVDSLETVTEEQQQQCAALADCLVRTGCLLVRTSSLKTLTMPVMQGGLLCTGSAQYTCTMHP